jgi:transcriptional regulator with XRE-family HTH domain
MDSRAATAGKPGSISVRIRAKNLSSVRRQLPMTQRVLARQVGVTQNYLSALENGHRSPSAPLCCRLILALDASFDELFDVVLIEDLDRETLLTRERR